MHLRHFDRTLRHFEATLTQLQHLGRDVPILARKGSRSVLGRLLMYAPARATCVRWTSSLQGVTRCTEYKGPVYPLQVPLVGTWHWGH